MTDVKWGATEKILQTSKSEGYQLGAQETSITTYKGVRVADISL